MIYQTNGTLILRDMSIDDPAPLNRAEIAQGWQPTKAKHLARLQDAALGLATVIVAELDGQPVGYLSVYHKPIDGPYKDKPYCEIVDFNVLVKARTRGIGTKLMELGEALAAKQADTVCLGVGLHSGYGAAQRLYVKRGYVPDGSGAWFGDKPAEPYQTYAVDDDLVIYMSKKLR